MSFNKPSMNGLNHFSIEDVNEDIATNASNIIDLENNKQDTLTAGNNITIDNNVISATDTDTTYTAGTNISISAGNVISATDTDTTYSAGNNITIDGNNVISATDTDTTYTAGTNISISAGNVISATDTDTTYTAGTNGGLVLNGSNEFSLDFSNTNARIEIPQSLHIEVDTTPQLLIEPASTTGNDAEIELRGARNATQSVLQARLLFSNYDNDLGGTKNLGEIAGKVLDHTLNLGGLGFYYYPLSQTRTQGAFQSAAGNWTFGTSVQNDFKVEVEGNTNITGNLEVVGNPNKRIAIVNLRKNDATNGVWGNGNYFDFGSNMYRIGNSFCSESFGVITLNTNGTYKISVSVQIENQTYNNRVVVGTYVSINNNTGNWRNESNSGRFGLTYIRFDDYGFGGSQYYSDYYELNSGNTIRIKTMLGEGSDARNYNDTENDDNIHLYGRLEVELISTTDLVESGV